MNDVAEPSIDDYLIESIDLLATIGHLEEHEGDGFK